LASPTVHHAAGGERDAGNFAIWALHRTRSGCKQPLGACQGWSGQRTERRSRNRPEGTWSIAAWSGVAVAGGFLGWRREKSCSQEQESLEELSQRTGTEHFTLSALSFPQRLKRNSPNNRSRFLRIRQPQWDGMGMEEEMAMGVVSKSVHPSSRAVHKSATAPQPALGSQLSQSSLDPQCRPLLPQPPLSRTWSAKKAEAYMSTACCTSWPLQPQPLMGSGSLPSACADRTQSAQR
jgi:hypothetical protein